MIVVSPNEAYDIAKYFICSHNVTHSVSLCLSLSPSVQRAKSEAIGVKRYRIL